MTTIQLKRKVPLSTYNEVLLEGEPLYDLVTKKLYVGNGASILSGLPFVGNYSIETLNVSSSIKSVALSSIFENNSSQVQKAVVASKIGSATIGGTTTPTYINLGDISLSTKYAGATQINLNGVSTSGQDAAIFAPTTVGTAGQLLVSQGTSNAPMWKDASLINVGSVSTASEDNLGNIISSTYGATIDINFNTSTDVLQLNLYKQDLTLLSSASVPVYIPTSDELSIEIDDVDYGAMMVTSLTWYPDYPSRPWAGGRLDIQTVGIEDPQLTIYYSTLCGRN